MSEQDNGGQAFPGERQTGQALYIEGVGARMETEPAPGMTLRDYFAARALQGFAADPNVTASANTLARIAYEWADAMLKARAA